MASNFRPSCFSRAGANSGRGCRHRRGATARQALACRRTRKTRDNRLPVFRACRRFVRPPLALSPRRLRPVRWHPPSIFDDNTGSLLRAGSSQTCDRGTSPCQSSRGLLATCRRRFAVATPTDQPTLWTVSRRGHADTRDRCPCQRAPIFEAARRDIAKGPRATSCTHRSLSKTNGGPGSVPCRNVLPARATSPSTERASLTTTAACSLSSVLSAPRPPRLQRAWRQKVKHLTCTSHRLGVHTRVHQLQGQEVLVVGSDRVRYAPAGASLHRRSWETADES